MVVVVAVAVSEERFLERRVVVVRFLEERFGGVEFYVSNSLHCGGLGVRKEKEYRLTGAVEVVRGRVEVVWGRVEFVWERV